eukprot:1975173-Rhodomonas_salina.1
MLSVESCCRCKVCCETHASNHASGPGTDSCSEVALRLLAFGLAVCGAGACFSQHSQRVSSSAPSAALSVVLLASSSSLGTGPAKEGDRGKSGGLSG